MILVVLSSAGFSLGKGKAMDDKKAISRRRFMQTAGIAAAGSLLASGTLRATGISTPGPERTKTVPLPAAAMIPPLVDMRPIIRNLGLKVRQQTDLAPCAVHAFTFLLECMCIRRTFSDLSEACPQSMTFQVERPPMKGGENFWALNIGYQKWGFVPQALVSNQSQDSGIAPAHWGTAGAKGCRLTQRILKEWDRSEGATQEQLDEAVASLDSDIPVAAGALWPKKHRSSDIDGIPAMVVPHAAEKLEVVFDGHAVALAGSAAARISREAAALSSATAGEPRSKTKATGTCRSTMR
jgi:hypothetical protein